MREAVHRIATSSQTIIVKNLELLVTWFAAKGIYVIENKTRRQQQDYLMFMQRMELFELMTVIALLFVMFSI